MNFPLEYPIFQFFYWLVNTAGVGGVLVLLVGGGSIFAYVLLIRWILGDEKTAEGDQFAYPTPALHRHERGEDSA